MRKFNTLAVITLLLFMASNANAQNGFDQLIRSSSADATKLVQTFAEPLFKGFGVGLNSGWNNTAKTKKFLHVDLRISANVAQVPASAQSFDVTKIGLSNHLQVDPSSATNIAPTFAGATNGPTPMLDVKDNGGNKIASFNMPNGVIKYIPAPNIQLTIGIFKNTDITVRTTPTVSIGSNGGSVGMIGFGIKHDILQDFVGKKADKLIPFDVAVAVNFNRINYSAGLNIQPDAGTQPDPGQSSDFSNQRVKGNFSGTFVQAIISKKLLFFTPFLSVGYQNGSTTFDVLGNYPVPSAPNYYDTITDPVHINENSISGFRTDVGFQLELSVFRIFASYSPGQYQSANAGIGFGF